MTPIEQLRDKLTLHRETVALGFAVLLFAFVAVYFLSLSIRYTDSDLWYHLAGGRYLLEQGALYNPFVNSYLEPQRPFTNYFWGFQTIVFSIWQVAGEAGLIVLKAALFLASCYFVLRILLGERQVRDATFLQLLVVAVVVAILCSRGLNLRPHVFSFAFIPVFIFILGQRPNLYPLLPLLTIAWVNIHGVEWVIGALICGSFFLQRLADYYFNPARDTRALMPLVWIALCLPAMMVSPNHAKVLLTPFITDPDLGLFISELNEISLTAAIDFSEGFTLNTLILVLLFFSGVSAWLCVRDLGKLRQHIAVLVMAAGGLVLLSMANRFVWEWALLSTPLVATGLQQWAGPRLTLKTAAALGVVLLLMPFTFWPAMRNGLAHYPFDLHSLPHGTTEFIRKQGITGRYALEPSYAGYAEFMLTPGVKIHMDMQFPPFTSMELQELNMAMLNADGLRTYVAKYEPTLIGTRKTNDHFPDTAARELGYVPVFFDNKAVLYLNSGQYPEIADTHALNAINPYNEDQVRPGKIAAAIEEVAAMLAIVDMPGLKLTLVGLLVEQGELEKAKLYIAELDQTPNETLSTAYFKGRIAQLEDNCPEAVRHYEEAIPITDDNETIHRYAAVCYFLMGDQHSAYDHFRTAINPYKDTAPDALAYYQFALSAVGVGKPEEAARLLTMTKRFAPESALSPQINDLLDEIRTE